MSTLFKLPLPRIVCEACGGTCVYKKSATDPDIASWLECKRCSKQWRDGVPVAIQNQDAFIDDAMATIAQISRRD